MNNLPAFPVRLSVILVALALGACASIEPKPLTDAEIRGQAVADAQQTRQGVEPIQGALSLEEAIARALKYNLERRVRMMEEALALRQLDVNKLDMLPKVLAQAGYTNRNNDYGTRNSNGLISGSQERVHTLSEFGVSWSLLDLGIGYYSSRQQADRFLIASEKRRKAMHLLMQDVRTAFWRVATAQRLQDQVRAAVKMSEEALADARKVEESRVRNPVDALRYQRQVLENLRLLEAIAQELSAAQIDLVALINAPMGTILRVTEPNEGRSHVEILKMPVERLEESALANNADLREQSYNARIAREDARKTLLRMFPNLGFNYGVFHDTDKFLVNDTWNRAGLQLSFNLINFFTYDIQKRLADGGVALADQRRVTAHAAVITQVHLARLQLANANAQLSRARDIYSTDRRLADLVANREAAQAQSKLERVSADAAAILSQLRYYQALSQVHAAEARLEATLGVDPAIGSVSEISLADLTHQLRAASQQSLVQKLTPATKTPPPAVKPIIKTETKAEVKPAAKPAPQADPRKDAAPEPKPASNLNPVKPAVKPEPVKPAPAKTTSSDFSAEPIAALPLTPAASSAAAVPVAGAKSPAAEATVAASSTTSGRQRLASSDQPERPLDPSIGSFAHGGLQLVVNSQNPSRLQGHAEGRR